jgi:hypothetical protein
MKLGGADSAGIPAVNKAPQKMTKANGKGFNIAITGSQNIGKRDLKGD